MLEGLRDAWDEQLRYGNTILLLCGSHIRTMESVLGEESALAGRLTGQWQLQPLPFHTLRQFFPSWDTDERIALFSILGGIPAYLSWLDPQRNLVENISDIILAPSSIFGVEPELLLYDELRELTTYLAVLKAIANGHHTVSAISRETLVSRTSLMFYLSRLQELQLVERRQPVAIPEDKRRRSKRGRYHLRDPYFQFYFRFMAPYLQLQRSREDAIALIEESLPEYSRAGFVELSREWIRRQVQSGRSVSALPFMPEAVGEHWSRNVQVEVAAVNWRTRDMLLGACDWSHAPVDAALVVDLAEKKTALLRRELPDEGHGWTFHYAVFTRTGLTEAAQAELLPRGGLTVHLSRLERGLGL
ncbi:MAG: ATP-binding protein [Candidatus Promineifilaceae bacterium]|nr:ATP-binding protein [Candidatus Promineifilaceae bacterium]